MTQFLKLVVALALVGIAGNLGYAAPVPTQTPAPPTPAVDPADPISDVRLGEMLDMMGLEVKRGTYKSGAFYYDTPAKTADYDFTIRIALSPSKKVIWFMVYLGDLPADVPAERLRDLLEAINTKTGKLQFRLTGGKLKVDQPMDNVAVTPHRIRREIDDVKATIQATDRLWNVKKWESNAVKATPTEPK